MNHLSSDDEGSASDPRPNSPSVADPQLDEGSATRWEKIRIGSLRVAAVFGAFLLVVTLLTAFSGIYTSRPEFCRSCHNMEPYYISWQESSHSHVSCVKCHFPPGVGEKIRGKMLGLEMNP